MPAVQEWAFVTRTWLFDQAIAGRVEAGVPAVANIGAGLDTRPYRMDLPAGLRWFELDLAGLLAEKSAALAGEQPRCELTRIAVDLADESARAAALARVGPGGLAVTEGVTVYLEEREVAGLARDLAAAGFDYWLVDLASPALLRMLQSTTGRVTAAAGAPLKFAPREGPAFFEPLGWTPFQTESVFETALKLGRVPAELLSAPPPPPGPDGPIWSGMVLLQRNAG